MRRRSLLLAAVTAVVLCLPVADGAAAPAPPTITGSTPASPANNNSPMLIGTADALTTINVFTDSSCTGTPVASAADPLGPFQVPVTVTDDTSTTFYASATDATSTTSACSSGFTYVEDSSTPPPAIESGPTSLSNSQNAIFIFTDSEALTTFECRLDGAPFAACESPQPYSGLGDGPHTFQVRATDALGNVSGATEFVWTIDTVAPQTTIDSAPAAASTSGTATFQFTSSEDGSTYFCSLDASGYAPCTSPKTYSGLGDGTHTFRVQAVDAAGNADATAATYTWTITGVGPATVDLKPPANVGRVRRNVGYGRLQLRWTRPADADFDHVGVYVSTSKRTAPRKLVYSGKAQSYTNRRFKNGAYYRYLIVSYDRTKNASGGSSAVVPPSALLRAPRNGSAIRRAPNFRWAAVRGASFYNIQLFHRGAKVLSAWPKNARKNVARRWTYLGRYHVLRKGAYVWYVWPGFGPQAKSRYGQLLGQGTFTVR